MTEIFGPGWGNYAIRGIIETSIPEQVSLRPATPGWWILLGLLGCSVIYVIWKRWQQHLRNRYRRDAQTALDKLETDYQGGDRECLRELAPLLRATALHATGQREELASVSGQAWQQALQDMAPKLPPLPIPQLEALAYRPLSDGSPGLDSLFTELRHWIALHELPDA
ncbi:DUF4381 domain-containing protein [Congregibacter sp.]|jgi:hypothetical protein|uniref:DUF4381 domain-containing protein n=1 Tax=Congregibacter sp. TaxID=2744308 RepID=UPI0039E544E3